MIVVLEGRTITAIAEEPKKSEIVRLDGCYVIKSNVPKKDAGKLTLHDRYKDLAHLEQTFRTMKTILSEMRPFIFVRKASRTLVHIFVAMRAYILAFALRRKWKGLDVTIEE
ncbi:MAG: hypothetical protein ACU843_13605 [Gammaproteobacteria bacterium]